MDTPQAKLPETTKFLHWLAHLLLRIFGWGIEGKLPAGGKAVVIAAPHTSYWDGPIMVTGGCAFNTRFSWMVKDAAFFFPLGILVRYFGGIPIDRSKRKNVVQQSIEAFDTDEGLLLAVAPEGTRSKTEYWKSGFYHIAQGAGVPIVFGYIDYGRKIVGLSDPFEPTGNMEADYKVFDEFYSKVTPKHPEYRGIVALRPEPGSGEEGVKKAS